MTGKRASKATTSGATDESSPRTPAQLVLDRILEIRRAEQLSIPQLATRLAEQGTDVTESRLWNISSGRARLQFETLIEIAAALDVSPLTLVTAPTDEPTEIEVLPGVIISADRWNAWMTGASPLPGADDATYAKHHPYGAQIGRYKGDLDQRARALAIRLAAHADEAATAAEALREEAHAYAASLLEGEPSADIIRSAEALSKRLGIDLSTLQTEDEQG
jgi:transcriptional regulator with XRE-family HTH domain